MGQSVTFYSGQKLRLGGILYLPPSYDSTSRYPAIVHCPGFRHGLKEYEFRIEPMMTALANAGYMVLYLHCRGFGLSEGVRYRSIPMEQIEDIRSAITYLQTRADINPDQIGLYGISLGGATAPYAAALDDRARCTVAATGFGDGEEWLRGLRREWEWQEFLRSVREDQQQKVVTGLSRSVAPEGHTNEVILILDPDSGAAEANLRQFDSELEAMMMPLEVAQAIIDFRPVDVVHRISPRPILYVAAEDDALCPPRGIVQMYAKTSPPKDIVILKGQTHRSIYSFPGSSSYTGDPLGGQELMRIAVAYFNKYLRDSDSS
jgi:cephalosporin-C deacetylase-like acetyl esterase